MRRLAALGAFGALTVLAACAGAQERPSVARRALADSSLRWIHRAAPGFRVYFLADTYPAQHQDSLLARLAPALAHAWTLIGAPEPPSAEPLHLFFVSTRPEIERLVGMRATAFAEPWSGTVVLMTNPEWRSFERHEIMHVVAHRAWGPIAPGTDWLQEGLAQFADAYCAGYRNEEVLAGLVERNGWIPFEDVVNRFREQSDLRAYLQAASFTGYLHSTHGPSALRSLWRDGTRTETRIGAEPLGEIERRWRAGFAVDRRPSEAELDRIEEHGCG